MNCQRIGLIGHPLSHTMSPFIHKNLFAISGIEYSYEIFDVPKLLPVTSDLKKLDGYNITIPYKEKIIEFLDEIDIQAKACGSVNTVSRRDGRMLGYTTDGIGCMKALSDAGIAPGGSILMLGNGGAARAISFALAELPGVRSITIICRSSSAEKAARLKNDLETFLRAQTLSASVLLSSYEALCSSECGADRNYDLLVNATSVGMYPKCGAIPVGRDIIESCRAVFDAVYNPVETELLRAARAAGIPTVNGIGMLVYQAAAAHEIWYNAVFKAEDLADICRRTEAEISKGG